MNRNAIVNLAKLNGFSTVHTLGGCIPLDDWNKSDTNGMFRLIQNHRGEFGIADVVPDGRVGGFWPVGNDAISAASKRNY